MNNNTSIMKVIKQMRKELNDSLTALKKLEMSLDARIGEICEHCIRSDRK